MKILVTGASGFVGGATVAELQRRGHTAEGTSRRHADWSFDLATPGEVEALLVAVRPEAVVHCAAVPDIAPCRADPALARRLNVDVSGELARGCAARGVRLVHVSTDQVFDGTRSGWREKDDARPRHEYGRSKLAGEGSMASGHPGATIVRPGLVTGLAQPGGRSSTTGLLAALQRAAAGEAEAPSMFTDEVRSPVALVDLARVLADLVERDEAPGVFHCGGNEALTRHDLARREAADHGYAPEQVGSGTRVQAGLADERPADLSLDSSRLIDLLGWTPRCLAEPDPSAV